ncbi:MAG: diacylglycerol kinase family lipid kinase [Actinobacteria bacterium]|nr:diacylglycerol kinase family lipid kinase [Actinomycetota bacterium]
MTWWTLINPGAGNGSANVSIEQRVRSALADHEVDAVINTTRSVDHLRELVRRGAAEGSTRFLAVGGDGTASLVADALMRLPWTEPPTLGILPAGSGSDYVRTFGFSQKLEEAVRHLTGSETYLVDVGIIEGSWGIRHFLNAANIGVLGATVKRAEQMSRRWGSLRYKLAFWLELPGFPRGPISLETERRTFEGDAITVVLANGQYFGAGVNIAPRATLIDGLLDVQVFTVSKSRIPLLYRKATRGLHLSDPGVERYRAERISIATDVPWPVEIDGDYLGETPIEVSLLPGALRFKI